MTDQFKVIVRSKEGNFSKSMTVTELVEVFNETLPAREVFFVVPHTDGKGYDLREAGLLHVDIQPAAQVAGVVPEVPKAPLTPPKPPAQYVERAVNQPIYPQEAPQPPVYGHIVEQPIPPHRPRPGRLPRGPQKTDLINGELAIPFKSQRQIAIDLGIEPPRPRDLPPKKQRKQRAKKPPAPVE